MLSCLVFFFLWEEIMWAILAMKRYTVYKVLSFSNSTNKLGIVLRLLFLDRYKSVMIPVSDRLPGSITEPRKSFTLGAVPVDISTVGFWLGLLWVMWWRKELGPDLSLSLLTTSVKAWHPSHSFYTVKVVTPSLIVLLSFSLAADAQCAMAQSMGTIKVLMAYCRQIHFLCIAMTFLDWALNDYVLCLTG